MTPDQLAQLLDELGRRLGPSGEYVFRLAVQRVIVNQLVWELMSGVAITAGIASALIGRRYWRSASETDRDEVVGRASDAMWWVGSSLPLIGIGLVVALLNLVPLLTPEYSALENILRTVTGK